MVVIGVNYANKRLNKCISVIVAVVAIVVIVRWSWGGRDFTAFFKGGGCFRKHGRNIIFVFLFCSFVSGRSQPYDKQSIIEEATKLDSQALHRPSFALGWFFQTQTQISGHTDKRTETGSILHTNTRINIRITYIPKPYTHIL